MNGKENNAKKRYTGPVKTYKFKLYKSTLLAPGEKRH